MKNQTEELSRLAQATCLTIFPLTNIFAIILNILSSTIFFKISRKKNNIYKYLAVNSIIDVFLLILLTSVPYFHCINILQENTKNLHHLIIKLTRVTRFISSIASVIITLKWYLKIIGIKIDLTLISAFISSILILIQTNFNVFEWLPNMASLSIMTLVTLLIYEIFYKNVSKAEKFQSLKTTLLIISLSILFLINQMIATAVFLFPYFINCLKMKLQYILLFLYYIKLLFFCLKIVIYYKFSLRFARKLKSILRQFCRHCFSNEEYRVL
jgi:hypothetical protein